MQPPFRNKYRGAGTIFMRHFIFGTFCTSQLWPKVNFGLHINCKSKFGLACHLTPKHLKIHRYVHIHIGRLVGHEIIEYIDIYLITQARFNISTIGFKNINCLCDTTILKLRMSWPPLSLFMVFTWNSATHTYRVEKCEKRCKLQKLHYICNFEIIFELSVPKN